MKKKTILNVFLYYFLLSPSYLLFAQGLLPPPSTSTVTSGMIEIGERVPETLSIVEENGKKRTFMSYKSPIEMLLVAFLSDACPPKQAQWPALRRLQENYEQWRINFVVVNTGAPEKLAALKSAVKRERLPWPVVNDNEKAAVTLLKISGTPQMVLIDESGTVLYRGPVKPVPNVLNTAISHIDAIVEPEPPLEDACGL